MTIATGDSKFACARWIVDIAGIAEGATHTTIQGAIDDASSGDFIFVKPGTYTENPVLKDGITLCSFTVGFNNQPTIAGKCSLSSGIANIVGLHLQTNADYALSVTSTGSVNSSFCFLEGTDNTVIEMSSSNSLRVLDSNINLTTTGIAIISQSAGATRFRRTTGSNVASSTTQSTVSSGDLILESGNLPILLSTSGSGRILATDFEIGSGNNVAVTTAGTATSEFKSCVVISGSAAAFSIGSGTTVQFEDVSVESTATNSITGAGTARYGTITFTSTGQGENVTTRTRRPLAVGAISFDGNTNQLQNYATGSWTPAIDAASSSPSVSYTTQLGKYTRIGNVVHIKCVITVNTISGGTGNIRITGIPFTASNDAMSSYTGSLNTTGVLWDSADNWLFQIVANTTTTQLLENFDNGAGAGMPIGNIANGDNISITATYWV